MKKFMNLIPGAVWDGVRNEFVIVGELTEEFAEEVISAGRYFMNVGRQVNWVMIDPKSSKMLAFNTQLQFLGSMTLPDLKLIRVIDEHHQRYGLVTRFER
jgi:hypothetical protein